MKYTVFKEAPGRMRVRLIGFVPDDEIDALISILSAAPGMQRVQVYGKAGQITLTFDRTDEARSAALAAMDAVTPQAIADARAQYSFSLAPRQRELGRNIVNLLVGYAIKRWFLPMPVRRILTIINFIPFAIAGLKELGHARLTVPVLDASAIALSLIKGDFTTAGKTMLLLKIGDTMEEYTRAMSEGQLINSLLDVNDNAQKVENGEEVSVPVNSLVPGDLVAIRTGMSVCVDGEVVDGTAMVNEATLTGEPLAVERTVGDSVFAGTVVEDGSIIVRVRTDVTKTKLRNVVSLVNTAESMKSSEQFRMERMADKVVPWNFLLTALVALTTKNIEKVSAALMVDYSCALKLTGSISAMTASSNAAKYDILCKGAKYFETFAKADTIVFDKTGTLTEATPHLATVISVSNWSKTEILRFSACLEEHFPHPVAKAVTRAAEERHLNHRERHAEVQYIVAHGIASSLEGKRTVIGSYHFVIEDEKCEISPEHLDHIRQETTGQSVLYLGLDGKVIGALGIEDPLKENVAEVMNELKDLGFEHIVMLTGDTQYTASTIAARAGITEFRANLLPEDKYSILEELKADGHTVAMVGDGVNDSPALSLADVGIAMGQGSDIAKEVASIVLTSSDMQGLVTLRRISTGMMDRMHRSYNRTMGFNSLLLILGIAGVITPATSSLLHNASTVLQGISCTKPYVE